MFDFFEDKQTEEILVETVPTSIFTIKKDAGSGFLENESRFYRNAN